LAGEVWDAICKLDTVTGISLAHIGSIPRSSSVVRRVKIVLTDSGLKLTVKQKGAIQDMYVFTTDNQKGMEEVSTVLLKEGISVHYT